MDQVQKQLQNHLHQLISGIGVCFLKTLTVPGLILLYSTIDIVASLARLPEEKSSKSFQRWVNDYLLKAKPLPCSAVDLYAARCGVLHTLTPDSDLSRGRKAKRISYAWGNASIETLKKVFRNSSDENVGLHINDLQDGLGSGIDLFFEDIEKDPKLKKRVEANAKKMFAMIFTSTKPPEEIK